MRKILIGVIVLLLMVLTFVTIYKGLHVLVLNIPSVEQIKQASEKLDKDIAEGNGLVVRNFPSALGDLEDKYKGLQKVKQEYDSMLAYSTSEEVKKAKVSEEYDIEFLWVKLGGYAKAEGLQAKFDLTESSKGNSDVRDIKFTLNGRYSGMVEFLYSIENDTKLDFKIEDFTLTGEGKDIQAEFTVKDLKVKQ